MCVEFGNLSSDWIKKLVDCAYEAKLNAYAPYSKFAVGAALLHESGRIYLGENIENASYGATICAERVAFIRGLETEKEGSFVAIAICGDFFDTQVNQIPNLTDASNGYFRSTDESKNNMSEPLFPCGICRQFMSEFAHEQFQVICAKSPTDWLIYTLDELLPYAFHLEDKKL